MSSLKYFIPIVVEGNKRNIQSKFFAKGCGKYNCVSRHFNTLTDILNQYNALMFPLQEITNHEEGPAIFTEDHCLYECSSISNKKYSITCMTDFSGFYNKPDDDVRPGIWVNYCDHAIFPSKFFAEYYNTLSSKNLYLGSPKYDVELNEKEIYEKYNINENDKCALVIFPRLRDFQKINLLKIYHKLHDMGYKVIVKTRGKDPVPRGLRGDAYFTDYSWHPHTTMELIKISDFIVNFSSTSIKECVLLKKPLINFHIKPFVPQLDFLYDYKFCKSLNPDFKDEEITSAIEYLMTEDLNSEYDTVIRKYLFERGNVSAKILDYFGIE